jgi:hypothetical protein
LKSNPKQFFFSGKTMIPFNTNAGYGVGSSFQTVKELCPSSRVLEGFSITGGVERDGVYFVIKGKGSRSGSEKMVEENTSKQRIDFRSSNNLII